MFKENLISSIKKISILEDRIAQLVQVRKKSEAVSKCKKLFHLSISFVSSFESSLTESF